MPTQVADGVDMVGGAEAAIAEYLRRSRLCVILLNVFTYEEAFVCK